MMQTTRIPSPARSQDAITPRRSKPRTMRSVSSSAVSGISGRQTSILDEFKEANRNSFAPSPLNKSVLTDNTEIGHPRRQSWWKKVNQSRNIDEVIGIETTMEPNNIMDDLEIEVLSQNKNDYSLDLPESSGSESIASIVLPQRKLLTQKENVPHDIFKQILGSRQSMTQQNKTNVEDKTVNISAKTLFGQGVKRSRPAFPAALLSRTPVKTQANKTRELPIEVKAQRHNIFGHRPDTERKNIFADFIVSESEDEVSDIQPKLFAFQRNTNPVRHSTASRASRGYLPIYRETSPASSITTDIEMEDWKMLPSSTMMEHQFEAGAASTPAKKARLSKFTKSTASKSNESKINANKDEVETTSEKQNLQLNKSKEVNNTSLKTFIEHEKSRKVTKNLHEPNTADIVQENENDDDENITLTYDDNEQPDNGESHAAINRVNKLEQQIEELFKENFPVNVSINKDNNANINQSKLKNICFVEEINDGKENYDNPNMQDKNLDITLVQNCHEKSNAEQQKLKEKDIDTADKEISITNEEIEVDQVGGFVEMADSENKAYEEEIQLEDDEEAQVEDDKDENKSEIAVESEEDHQNESEEENDEDQNKTEIAVESEEEQQNESEVQNEEDPNEDKDQNKTEISAESEEEQQNESEVENEEDRNEDEDQNKTEIAVESEEEQQNESEVQNEEDQNKTEIAVESEEEQQNESEEENEEDQNKTEIAVESEEEQQNESEEENEEEQQNESEVENEEDQNKTEIAEESEEEQQNESEVENEENQNEDEDVCMDVEQVNVIEDLIEEIEENLGGEVQESEQQEIEDSETSEAEAINSDVTHGTTGKSHQNDDKSLEAVLDNISNQNVSFIHKGRNTSIRKTVLKNLTIRQSVAPLRESTGLDDRTKNSSAEGSCWDSHRTTRKTLRQTFGQDFTPRKSLRTLVMEKSAKRQTAINEANAKLHQANSTEIPGHNTPEIDVEFDNVETIDVSNHEISKRTRQTKLEAYLQNVKKAHMESKLKTEAEVRNLLIRKPVKVDALIRAPYKSIRKTNIKSMAPKAKKRTKPNVVPLEDMPEEFIEDMKYRPPKRYQPRNAPWITKRLYKFLETKLEAKYDYKARLRAEKLMETLYEFTRRAHKQRVASPNAIAELEHEMARLDIVKTHLDFYDFFHDYMPREVIIKVVPDIVNNIPLPRNGPFSNIIE